MRRLRLSIMSSASSIVPSPTPCTMGLMPMATAPATGCAGLIGEVAAAGVTAPMSGTMASTEEGAGTEAEAGEQGLSPASAARRRGGTGLLSPEPLRGRNQPVLGFGIDRVRPHLGPRVSEDLH